MRRLRQLHRPRLLVRILPVEERGMTHRADAHAATFVGDLNAECRPLIAVGPEETQFYEFVGPQLQLQFGKESRRQSGAPNLQVIRQPLAKTAEVGFLGTGEGKFVHGPKKVCAAFVRTSSEFRRQRHHHVRDQSSP